VSQAVKKILDEDNYDDGSIGPVLVRLAWHASGTYDTTTKTGGSDGATMRFTPEAAFGANAGAPARAACAGHISVTGAGGARCDGAAPCSAAASRPALSTDRADGCMRPGLAEARKRLEPIKAQFPGLSYADLWILASYVAIEDMGGPKMPFRAGRSHA